MFNNLRSGAPIYILHKQEPNVEVGEVISVGQPQPQYPAYQNGMIQQPRTLVDVRVKVGEQTIDLQKLPSDLSVADCNGMVVSETKESILNEVAAMSKISQSVLDSVDRHKSIVEKCSQLIEELNPEVKREAERAKELCDLRSEVGELKTLLSQLLNKNKKGE